MFDKALQNKIKLTGKIFPNLVHTIKNPLSVLKLNHYYLKLLKESLPTEAVASLNDCSEAALRIEKAIDTYSLLSPKYSDVIDTCSINDISVFAIEIMEISAKRKNLSFEKEFDDSIPEININRSKVLQVFLNIFSYFIELKRDCKKIRIKTFLDDSCNVVWETTAQKKEDSSTEIIDDDFLRQDLLKEFEYDLQVCEKLLLEDKILIQTENSNGVYSKFTIKFDNQKHGIKGD